ncbi:MAG: hypothetical protein KIT74_01360 [Fimbriimonadales bacterium]|nr:hypothetical protein [Fimbriimonadales bacterium]
MNLRSIADSSLAAGNAATINGKLSALPNGPGCLFAETIINAMGSKQATLPSRNWIVFSAVGVLIVLIVAFILLRSPSREAIARVALGAFAEGDAETILQLLRKEEIELCGLTSDSLKRFWACTWGAERQDFVEQGAPVIEEFEGQRLTSITQMYVSKAGAEVGIGFAVADTDSGPKLVTFVRPVVQVTLAARWPSNLPQPRGIQRHEYWASELTKMLPELEESGVKGVAIPEDRTLAKFKFLTWREYIDEQHSHIKRLQEANQ